MIARSTSQRGRVSQQSRGDPHLISRLSVRQALSSHIKARSGMINRLTLPMKSITKVREKTVCFGRLRTFILPKVRGFTPMNEDRNTVSQVQGNGRKVWREANEQTCQNLRT